MAMNAVTSALSKLVVETRLDVVEKMKAFLQDKLEMEESDLNDLVEEFKGTLELAVKETKVKKGKKGSNEEGEEKPKKKRAAGPYNLFLGEQIKILKAASPDSKESKKFMAQAQEAWKALKEKYPDMASDSAKLYAQWKEDSA